MSGPWNYGGDLNNPADLVRYLIGDTTQAKHSPTDTEIEYWMTVNTTDGTIDAYKAAAQVARHLATRFRTLANSQVKIGDMSLTNNYGTLADQYIDTADRLDGGANAGGLGGPRWDTSVAGSFSMGLMDHP
jgi:hypothetical protein